MSEVCDAFSQGQRKASVDDSLHIFLIGNPMNEIIAAMWIEQQALSYANIIFLMLRDQQTHLLNVDRLSQNRTFTDRLVRKFGYDFSSRKLVHMMDALNRPFLVYSSWLNPECGHLIEAKNCVGHFYIEEGQLSHWNRSLASKTMRFNRWKSPLKKTQLAEQTEFLQREDGLAFIGIDKDAFRHIPASKRIILENFSCIKRLYEPKLLGKTHIGIGPAFRRVNRFNLKAAIRILIDQLPDKSLLKLHPGNQMSESEKTNLLSDVRSESGKCIFFCDNDVILEAEMMFESKTLHGPQSSLERYSTLFGSSYKRVNLY